LRSIPKVLLKDYTQNLLDIDESTLDRNSSVYLILQRVGRRKDVLDVGCATGYLAKLMSAHDCSVTGIDINAESAEVAKKYCTNVFVADLDFTGLSEAVEGRTFDVIVFGDVLEHLRYPARILEEARTLLRAGGYVVASIPNIAHGTIRLALLRGDFDYGDMGILDETHLRFFTLKTIEELFLQAGYEIGHIDRTKVELFDNSSEQSAVPNIARDEFNEETIAQIQKDPEFDTLQFVVQALPLSDEDRLGAITKQFVKVNTELTRAKGLIERRERELAAARAAASADSLQDSERAPLSALESELKQRASEREALAADRDAWRARVDSELPAAQAEVARLTAAQQAAVAERERLLSEIERRVTEREALSADRETWRVKYAVELPVLQAEIARLSAEQAALSAERDRLLSELGERAAQREAVATENQALVADRERLLSELGERAAQREAVATENQALVAERDRLRAELDIAAGRVGDLDASMEVLQTELNAVKEELASTRAQRDSASSLARQQSLVAQRLQQSVTQITAELARVSDAMRGAHDEMIRAQEAFARVQDELERERRENEAKAAEIRGNFERLSAEHRELREWATSHATIMLAEAQQDAGELVNLINTVQLSRFWRIKKVVNHIVNAFQNG